MKWLEKFYLTDEGHQKARIAARGSIVNDYTA